MCTAKYECHQSIVGYADILGMEEKIKQLNNNLIDSNKLLEQIGRIIDEAKEFLGITAENNPNKKIKFFTDNIIFSWVIREGGEGESEILNTLKYMATYQLHFSLNNYFVRGALTNGINFINEDFVFGPATVESYNSEKDAINPRIILCNSIVDSLKKFSSYYSATPYHRKWILKDQDEKYFVNYLYTVVDFMNQCKEYHEGFKLLKNHKENIEKNLCEHNNNNKIWRKYSWLARYNNYFCNNVLRNEYDRYTENLPDIGITDISDYQHFNEFDFKKAIDDLIIGNNLLNNDFTLCDL